MPVQGKATMRLLWGCNVSFLIAMPVHKLLAVFRFFIPSFWSENCFSCERSLD